MKDTLVQDIMVPLKEYPCICDTYTLRRAIEEMGKAQIRRNRQVSLPRVALVFDERFAKLLGMLRRRDIMRGLEPDFLLSGALEYRRKLFNIEIDPNLSELSHDKIIARIRERAEHLVRKFMTPIRATVAHDDHIIKAMYEMVNENTSLLPVLKGDSVIGVVRSVDLLSEIARIIDP